MLDFRIATFLQLCETKSYTKTAKLLGMTQPSVTQHIKHLQKCYGCKLFVYEGKTLHLTAEGEYLRRQAELMTKMSKRIRADLLRMGEMDSAVRFGFPTELGEARAAAVIARLMHDKPDDHIILQTGTMQELSVMAEDGALDLILTDKAFASQTMTSFPAGKLRFGCYVSASLSGDEPMHTKQILQQTLLTREDVSGDRTVMEQLLAKKNLAASDFAVVYETNSPVVVRQMTASGQGVSFAYASAMEGYDAKQLPQGDLSDERTLVFLCRKDAAEPERFRQFAEAFKKTWFA